MAPLSSRPGRRCPTAGTPTHCTSPSRHRCPSWGRLHDLPPAVPPDPSRWGGERINVIARRAAASALALLVLIAVTVVAVGERATGGRPALARLAGLALVVGLLTIAAADPLAGPTQARTAPVAERTFARIAALSGPNSVRLLNIGVPSSTPAIVDGPDLQIPAQPETPPHPEVVRFRPFDRAVQVRPDAPLSVRFTQPMDHASTQAALRVSDLDLTRGRFRWAENDTVLVFTPSVRLEYGKRYTMSLVGIVRSADGMPIDAAAAAAGAESSFTVMPKPKPAPKTASTRVQATRLASGLRWASPLRGPITQYFGQHLTRFGIHMGIDIDGTTGDSVRAAATGTVIAAGWVDACSGIAVGLDHGSGLSSWYRHLSRVAVRVGQRVSVGSIIGRVGNTGCSLGSHLHFAIRRGDTYLNPLSYVPRW